MGPKCPGSSQFVRYSDVVPLLRAHFALIRCESLTIRCDSPTVMGVPNKPTELFNREAFVALLDRSHYASPSDFAKRAGISPGALHDITTVRPGEDKPRRTPSLAMVKKLAAELKVPLPALLRDPALAQDVA